MSEATTQTESTSVIGGFKLNYVHLYASTGDEPIDITELISNVDVYESMTSPFMTIDVTIIDNIGLMDKLPIIGEEFINLDIRDQGNDVGLKSYMGFIYKVADRAQVSDRGFAYTLKCISLECLTDLNLKLSRAFSGTPSEIVKTFLSENGPLKTNKTLYLEDSKNHVEYISPYWSPMENIRFLTERAVSKENGAPSYMFFENMKGFVFSSLDALVDQESSYSYYYTVNPKLTRDKYQLDAKGDTLFETRNEIVENLWVDDSNDYFAKLKGGAFGVRTLQVDPFKKEYSYDGYDFLESFARFNRLNVKPFNSDYSVRKLNSVFRTKVTPSSAYTGMLDDGSNDWFKRRLTEISALNANSIQIDVPGKFGVHAGNVISLFVFSGHIPTDDNASQSFKDLVDRVLSGNYLVTSVHHTFTSTRHSMSMQLNKESLI